MIKGRIAVFFYFPVFLNSIFSRVFFYILWSLQEIVFKLTRYYFRTKTFVRDKWPTFTCNKAISSSRFVHFSTYSRIFYHLN